MSINELKCLANVEFRPGPVAIISSSINLSAIILFTVSSINGRKAANADAADASVIADEIDAPDGNAPAGGGVGGGGGDGGGGLVAGGGAGGGGFDGVIAGVGIVEGGKETIGIETG